jgi:hypothetical protein
VSPNRSKATSMPCLEAMKSLMHIRSPNVNFQNIHFVLYSPVNSPRPIVQTTSHRCQTFYSVVEVEIQFPIKQFHFSKQGYTLSFPVKATVRERHDGRSQSNEIWLNSQPHEVRGLPSTEKGGSYLHSSSSRVNIESR